MSEVRELAGSVLEKGYLMSLATVDEVGVWVCDLVYTADADFNLYWLSHTGSRHSVAIGKNGEVAATVTLTTGPGEDNVGVQISGRAEKVDGDMLEIAKKHRLKRGKTAPEKEGEILGEGESWYKLIPKKMELIYASRWGYEKKVLEF